MDEGPGIEPGKQPRLSALSLSCRTGRSLRGIPRNLGALARGDISRGIIGNAPDPCVGAGFHSTPIQRCDCMLSRQLFSMTSFAA